MPERQAPDAVVLTAAVLRDRRLPVPGDGATKEDRGRVLVVGGAVETPGAVLLAATAALCTGAGKLQVATVGSVAVPMAIGLPEALVRGLPETPDGAIAPSAVDDVAELGRGAEAVLLGPGMAGADAASSLFEPLLPRLTDATLVLDAIGLAVLSAAPDCLRPFDGRAVLTPNLNEAGILLGTDADEVATDPGAAAGRIADRYGAVVAIGGSRSWVVTPDGAAWCDETGSAGLGTSGSGDVLAGVVAGLAARGADPATAAIWAVHVHGRAGDRLAAKVGRLGYLARELVTEIPGVLTELDA